MIHPRTLYGFFNDCVDSSMMVDKNRLRRSCDLHSLLLAASALSQAHVVPLKSCLEDKRAKNPAIIAISPHTHTQKHQITIYRTLLDEPVSGRLQRLRESREEVSEGELEGEESGGEEEPGWQFFSPGHQPCQHIKHQPGQGDQLPVHRHLAYVGEVDGVGGNRGGGQSEARRKAGESHLVILGGLAILRWSVVKGWVVHWAVGQC